MFYIYLDSYEGVISLLDGYTFSVWGIFIFYRFIPQVDFA